MPDFGKLVKQVTKPTSFLYCPTQKKALQQIQAAVQVLYSLGLYDTAGMTVLEFSAANEVTI